jgi:hypothetical protein
MKSCKRMLIYTRKGKNAENKEEKKGSERQET